MSDIEKKFKSLFSSWVIVVLFFTTQAQAGIVERPGDQKKPVESWSRPMKSSLALRYSVSSDMAKLPFDSYDNKTVATPSFQLHS